MELTAQIFGGWAWRPDLPNTSIKVHIYLTNTTTGQSNIFHTSAVANMYRGDLVSVGIGNGYHGFCASIDWNNYPAGNYSVVVYAIGENGNNPALFNSPRYYTNSNSVVGGQVSGLTDTTVYNITNKASSKCLNVNYGTDANGTNVNQYTNDGSAEQMFKLVYNSARNSYKLHTMSSTLGTNRVLDVYRPIQSGSNVDIWTPNDNDAQDFFIVNRGIGKLIKIQ